MRGDMQVRFGGRYGKTYCRKAVRRSVPSLRLGKGGDIFHLAGELTGSTGFMEQLEFLSGNPHPSSGLYRNVRRYPRFRIRGRESDGTES